VGLTGWIGTPAVAHVLVVLSGVIVESYYGCKRPVAATCWAPEWESYRDYETVGPGFDEHSTLLGET
jgi:hypothetical protein